MKKLSVRVVCSIIALLCLFSLTACDDILEYESEFVREIFFYTQDGSNDETSSFLIKSYEQKNRFLQDYCDQFTENGRELGEDYLREGVEEINNLFEKYDEQFFEKKNLVLVGIEETSGSNRHSVKKVSTVGNTISIEIKRKIPEVGTCDMAYWHLFLSFSKSDFDGDNLKISFAQ